MTEPKLPSIQGNEQQVKRTTVESHRADVHLMDRLLAHYSACFSKLDSFTPQADKNQEFAWFLLSIRVFNSLRCAFDLACRGYYSQAMMLVRSANEDWLVAKYVEVEPSVLSTLLEDEGKMPRFQDMADKLGDQYGKWWRQEYGEVQSKYAHTRTRALQVLFDPATRVFRRGGHYEEHLFKLAVFSFVHSAIRMLNFLYWSLGPLADECGREGSELVEESQQWLRQEGRQDPE